MSTPAPPLLVVATRGAVVESEHRGHVVAVALDGSRLLALGDVDAPVLSRSSLKPLQALGLVHAGWQPEDHEMLALACASHNGEPEHVAVVRRILASAGLDADALDNTPDLPLHRPSADAVVRAGGGPARLLQNCSGKHAAMLATCVANGWPVDGYRDPAHPVQQAIATTVAAATGAALGQPVVDGCGAPMWPTPLAGLAGAYGRMAAATEGPQRQVADGMRRHPQLVGGTGRDVTTLMQAVPGLVAKDGAEGVYAAGLADGRGIAVKISDGAGRARTPVLVEALRRLGVDAAALAPLATVPVLGHGEPVGAIRAAGELGRHGARDR